MEEKENEVGLSVYSDDTLDHMFRVSTTSFDPMYMLYNFPTDICNPVQNCDIQTVTNDLNMTINTLRDVPTSTTSIARSTTSYALNRRNVQSEASNTSICTPVTNESVTLESDSPQILSIHEKLSSLAGDERANKSFRVADITALSLSSKSDARKEVIATPLKENMKQRKLQRTVLTEMHGEFTELEQTPLKRILLSGTPYSAESTEAMQMMYLDCFQEGPLSILRRSQAEKLKVRVWTRSVRNIRGICTGYIVAFDKHMNLAMVDVDEVYRKTAASCHRKQKQKASCLSDQLTESAQCKKDCQRGPDDQVENCYPNVPWQTIHDNCSSGKSSVLSLSSAYQRSTATNDNVPTGKIRDLESAFDGMQVFGETESCRFLGVKSRRLLTRHLNQVLLRGEHVVAVAIADL